MNEEDETMRCPHCDEEVLSFIRVGNQRTPSCPHCKKFVKDVPQEFVKHVEKGYTNKVDKTHEETHEKPSFFKSPRSPHEVLKDVLSSWDVKEKAIKKISET